jgi:hypothetical protein
VTTPPRYACERRLRIGTPHAMTSLSGDPHDRPVREVPRRYLPNPGPVLPAQRRPRVSRGFDE